LRDWLLGTSRGAMLRLLDPGFGRPALFTGDRLLEKLREVVGTPRIEDLPIDFTAVAVDLMRQREVWLRRGDLWDALRASFAIPGIFTPYTLGGRELVDGGLLAPLPITATRLSGAHIAWSRWTCTAGRIRHQGSSQAKTTTPKARARPA
jgi:NTE family protein